MSVLENIQAGKYNRELGITNALDLFEADLFLEFNVSLDDPEIERIYKKTIDEVYETRNVKIKNLEEGWVRIYDTFSRLIKYVKPMSELTTETEKDQKIPYSGVFSSKENMSVLENIKAGKYRVKFEIPENVLAETLKIWETFKKDLIEEFKNDYSEQKIKYYLEKTTDIVANLPINHFNSIEEDLLNTYNVFFKLIKGKQ